MVHSIFGHSTPVHWPEGEELHADLSDKSGHYLVFAKKYDTQKGTGLELRYYPNWPKFVIKVLVRTAHGYVAHDGSYDDMWTAAEKARSLRGAPPKKKSKTKRKDPKAAERMRWWTPDERVFIAEDQFAVAASKIKSATCLGFCTVDKDTARVYRDVSDPEVVEELYFLVQIQDFRNRSVLLLLTERADRFMVAIEHNKDVVKLTGDDKIFTTSGAPLVPGEINVVDMQVIQEAIRLLQ